MTSSSSSVQVDQLLANVPLELRVIPQWVVWRPVEKKDPKTGEVRVTEPPFRASDPAREASTKDPTSWGTFDEAIAACRKWPAVLGGIGFVFTYGCGYVGIDVDDLRRVLAEHLATRHAFEAKLDEELFTYCKNSPSGNGKHFILRGQLPGSNGCPKSNIKMELYGWNGFLTFTGHVINGKTEIKDEQEFIDRSATGSGVVAPIETMTN